MAWPHVPRIPILIWCIWVFPFTLWDTLYLALRPYSLPGGKWNEPYFGSTFNTWAAVDQIYGLKGWEEKDGWVLAQSAMNMLEAVLCITYVWIVWGRGTGGLWSKRVGGRAGGMACLVGFGAGAVTWVKSAMYFLREPFGHFKYTGHNGWKPFLVTWVGMNILYIASSSYMIFTSGKDILHGLEGSGKSEKKYR